MSWDAYNESVDLLSHLEKYKSHYGYYPYRVLDDKIYLNRQNGALMKELGNEVVGAALGNHLKNQKRQLIKQQCVKQPEKGMK